MLYYLIKYIKFACCISLIPESLENFQWVYFPGDFIGITTQRNENGLTSIFKNGSFKDTLSIGSYLCEVLGLESSLPVPGNEITKKFLRMFRFCKQRSRMRIHYHLAPPTLPCKRIFLPTLFFRCCILFWGTGFKGQSPSSKTCSFSTFSLTSIFKRWNRPD